MTVSNSGMTLHIDNDSDSGWSGEDGTSTEVFWQGSGAQKWIVAKNVNETATLSLSADMSAAKYFTFAMLSTIAPFYTSIGLTMKTDASNHEHFLLSDNVSAVDVTYRAIAGEFKYSTVAVEFGQGTTTGTYNRASHATLDINVDNSSSGNIRSVENHYIDAMYYGNGRTISGTTVSDKLFEESNDLNISADVLDCCTLAFHGKIFAQTDLIINTTTGNSFGETLVFVKAANTSNAYSLDITNTADFRGTNIEAEDGATVAIDTTTATSFDMAGGGIRNALTVDFTSGQNITGAVLTKSGAINPNGAVFNGNTISNSTVDTTTGSLYINSSVDLTNYSKLIFNEYTGKYAIYIPATVTGTISLDNFIGDGSGTDVYWAATSGTLIINKSNGTNFTTWAAGGTATVALVSSVSIGIHVEDESEADLAGILVYVDEDLGSAGEIINTTTDISGNVSTSYSGAATSATVRIRKYGYKRYVGTITLTADSSTNIILTADPQQT